MQEGQHTCGDSYSPPHTVPCSRVGSSALWQCTQAGGLWTLQPECGGGWGGGGGARLGDRAAASLDSVGCSVHQKRLPICSDLILRSASPYPRHLANDPSRGPWLTAPWRCEGACHSHHNHKSNGTHVLTHPQYGGTYNKCSNTGAVQKHTLVQDTDSVLLLFPELCPFGTWQTGGEGMFRTTIAFYTTSCTPSQRGSRSEHLGPGVLKSYTGGILRLGWRAGCKNDLPKKFA